MCVTMATPVAVEHAPAGRCLTGWFGRTRRRQRCLQVPRKTDAKELSTKRKKGGQPACEARGQAAMVVCHAHVHSGAIQLQTRRIAPIRKRDSRQPVWFQIGESPVGTPRADRKFNVTKDDRKPPKAMIQVWGNAPRRTSISTRRR